MLSIKEKSICNYIFIYILCLLIFRIHSSVKIVVISILIISKFLLNSESGSFNGFSIASVIDDIKITSIMKNPNHEFVIILFNNFSYNICFAKYE